jgi:SAM-dependent methyltransferase
MSGAFRVGGDAYDDFMGRYSTRLAPLFADFVGVEPGARVLDVGAGTGALTAVLVARGANVAAADPSPEFVAVLRERFPGLEVHEAPAEALPFEAGEFDAALAQLVVAFMADAPAAIGEMARLARRVAVCMWGVAEVDMFAAIDRTAAAIGSSRPTEPRRYRTPHEIRGPARAARRGRGGRAGRDSRLRRLRGVLAGHGSRRRASGGLARLARCRGA